MAEKKTVAFRIDESVKEEWERATEDPKYNSLSHLIRLAVQREIADAETEQTDGQTAPGSDRDAEILEYLTRLERTVEEINDEVEAMGRESRAEELYDLEQVLLELLPTSSEDLDVVQELTPEQFESGATTAREMAGRIGADTSDVADALGRLTDNMVQVQSVTDRQTDETYYWKSE